jgi:hypothetical protein
MKKPKKPSKALRTVLEDIVRHPSYMDGAEIAACKEYGITIPDLRT